MPRRMTPFLAACLRRARFGMEITCGRIRRGSSPILMKRRRSFTGTKNPALRASMSSIHPTPRCFSPENLQKISLWSSRSPCTKQRTFLKKRPFSLLIFRHRSPCFIGVITLSTITRRRYSKKERILLRCARSLLRSTNIGSKVSRKTDPAKHGGVFVRLARWTQSRDIIYLSHFTTYYFLPTTTYSLLTSSMDLFNKKFFHLAFGFISIVMISVLAI